MKLKTLSILLFFSFQGFSQTPELIFHSGFEPSVIDITNGIVSDIWGMDNSVSPPNDWVYDLEAHPNIGNFSIQYQGGDDTMRMASIVPDPTDSLNNVLHYWLKYPNVAGIKGRIQANLYGNINFTEFYQSTRLFLPSADWNILKNAAGATITWMVIQTYWNNIYPLDTLYPFKISLGIHKKKPFSTKLTFDLTAKRMDVPPPWPIVWSESDTSFSIPVDQWMTIETYFKEGDSNNGRFVMSVTPDGGIKQTLFDITNYTHHPADPNPDGLAKFNPMKLYTSSAVIDYVRMNGGVLQVYWDDFELWKDTNIVLNIPKNKTIGNYKLYPNPMGEYAILEFNYNPENKYTLILYDTQGRIIKTITGIKSEQVEIRNENLNSGLYFFQLTVNGKSRITGKLMVE